MSFHLLPSESAQVSARCASEVKCASEIFSSAQVSAGPFRWSRSNFRRSLCIPPLGSNPLLIGLCQLNRASRGGEPSVARSHGSLNRSDAFMAMMKVTLLGLLGLSAQLAMSENATASSNTSAATVLSEGSESTRG